MKPYTVKKARLLPDRPVSTGEFAANVDEEDLRLFQAADTFYVSRPKPHERGSSKQFDIHAHADFEAAMLDYATAPARTIVYAYSTPNKLQRPLPKKRFVEFLQLWRTQHGTRPAGGGHK